MAQYLTCYMSTTIDLPPHVAQAALAATTTSPFSIPAGAGQLRLRPNLTLRHDWLLAVQPGVLVHKLQRLAVELELTPWSSSRTEIGLRPVPRVWTGWPSDALMRTGHLALQAIKAPMLAWADEPLRIALRDLDTAFAA